MRKALCKLPPNIGLEGKFRSCKLCHFYKNGYCTQVQPPSIILNEYEAQLCIYYSPETVTTGEITRTERETQASQLDVVKKIEGDVKVDHTKVKGVALKEPTVSESLPISIENDAIAYDPTEDRFKVDVEAMSAGKDRTISGDVEVVQPNAADLKATVTQAEKDRTVSGTATVTQASAERTLPHLSTEDLRPKIGLSAGSDQMVVEVATGKKAIIYGYNIVNNDAANVGDYLLYLGSSATPLYVGKIPKECPVLKTFVHPIEGADGEDVKVTIVSSTDTDIIIFADVVDV